MHFRLFNRSLLLIAFVGDLLCYYLSLAVALTLRYGPEAFTSDVFLIHQYAFTYGLALWLMISYIGGLFEEQSFTQKLLEKRFFITIASGGVALILMFYFIPSFGITPKLNLLLFILIYAAIGYGWRIIIIAFNKSVVARGGGFATLLVGDSPVINEMYQVLMAQQQIIYRPVSKPLSSLVEYGTAEKLIADARSGSLNLIVASELTEKDPKSLRLLYEAGLAGSRIIAAGDFYEQLFEKVSIATLDDFWFIRNLSSRRLRYQPLRRLSEIVAASVLLVLLSPFFILCGAMILLTSRGGVFYKQTRVGFDGKLFNVRKMRTMYAEIAQNPDAKGAHALWTQPDDKRITPVGRFLRATHLDELPQLLNIINGSMSFVGPRPERPEFTRELEKSIPYYELRYLVRPGIAGWAQLHFKYGASVDDAYQKLQYDLFYIKHQTLLFDLSIVLKTIKRIFFSA